MYSITEWSSLDEKSVSTSQHEAILDLYKKILLVAKTISANQNQQYREKLCYTQFNTRI